MKQGSALKVLNLMMGFLVLVLFFSGLLHGLLSKHVFLMLHIPGGMLLVIGTVVHVIDNRAWVKASYFRKKRRETPPDG